MKRAASLSRCLSSCSPSRCFLLPSHSTHDFKISAAARNLSSLCNLATPIRVAPHTDLHRHHHLSRFAARGRHYSNKMSTHLSRAKLEGEERERRLREEVPYWRQVQCRDAIQRTFTFKDFKEAWRFMSLTADKAEEMDHHPEWFNVYNKVEVTLATHTCNGVSEYDIELAKAMDQFALQTSDETAAREQAQSM